MDNERISAHRVPGSERGIWPLRRRMYDVVFTDGDGIQHEVTIKARGGNQAIRIAKVKLKK